MNRDDLEFILYILLGGLTGIAGIIASLFIAYIANYKKYWRIFIGFLAGYLTYAIFIRPGLTFTGNLVFGFIQGIIAFGIAYIIHEDKLKNGQENKK